VFSLALVIGDSPNREWLVYLHSPLKVYSGVQVAIPGYGQIIANSSPGGSFYHVVENTKEVTEIQQPDVAPRQQDVGPVQPPINLRIVTK